MEMFPENGEKYLNNVKYWIKIPKKVRKTLYLNYI